MKKKSLYPRDKTDSTDACDAHISGTNVARCTVESSFAPRDNHAFLCVRAVQFAWLRFN